LVGGGQLRVEPVEVIFGYRVESFTDGFGHPFGEVVAPLFAGICPIRIGARDRSSALGMGADRSGNSFGKPFPLDRRMRYRGQLRERWCFRPPIGARGERPFALRAPFEPTLGVIKQLRPKGLVGFRALPREERASGQGDRRGNGLAPDRPGQRVEDDGAHDDWQRGIGESSGVAVPALLEDRRHFEQDGSSTPTSASIATIVSAAVR
jgi:hypothetical protein